tara:strand:+ start:216 stop:431 length:216 start_codon:yes stop_codon:yes gene_type:complete
MFKKSDFNLDPTQTVFDSFAMKLFLSLSLHNVLTGLEEDKFSDEISKEMDAMLFDMIVSASEVLVDKPITA